MCGVVAGLACRLRSLCPGCGAMVGQSVCVDQVHVVIVGSAVPVPG